LEKECCVTDNLRGLISRCLSGEQSAIGELVARYRAQVYGLCLRMLGQHQDAEDVLQETFVRAVRSLRNWDSQREFGPWLLAIAGNRCRTALAARRRRPTALANLGEWADDRPADPPGTPVVEEVRTALAELRDEYRQAFLLYHLEQRGYAEISQILNCPIGTVKTWVHRARLELIETLRKRGTMEEREHVVR